MACSIHISVIRIRKRELMNKTILIGRITKDLEIRKTPSGNSVINFTLAVNRYSKDKENEADFIQCQSWGKTAELMHTYLNKGSQIGVEGRIQTRNYENKQGQRVYVTEVIVERVEFLESKKDKHDREQTGYYTQNQEWDTEPILDITSDDLPF